VGREAVTVFADPRVPMDTAVYSHLINRGLRRSGDYVYRPNCPHCRACISVRIPVAVFRANRSQARTWRRNQDLEVRKRPARFDPDQFRLYQAYVKARHPGGGMDTTEPDKYLEFFTSTWCHTVFYEFHQDNRLFAVAVVDHLLEGLSAVYTFFDPIYAKRSLGTYAILWEIEEACRLGLKWLYLGYWVKGCAKMMYKSRYRPFEVYYSGRWIRVD
jgi:arginyl-tRNA--protein-N-Asp/Glu arginylyltransferase